MGRGGGAQGRLTMQEDAMMKAFDKHIPFSEVDTLSTLLLAGDDIAEAPAVQEVPPVDEKESTEL